MLGKAIWVLFSPLICTVMCSQQMVRLDLGWWFHEEYENHGAFSGYVCENVIGCVVLALLY